MVIPLFRSQPLCESQRLALVEFNAPDAHSVGETGMGVAVCHGAGSERYYAGKARTHKKLTEWAHQMVLQVRRWLPKRLLVVVADSSFAVIDLLWQLRQLKNPICMITRFRLDAAVYGLNAPTPGKMGRLRKKGKRLPTLEKIAEDKLTRWKRLTVQEWCGEKKRNIEITSKTAIWFHSGKPPLSNRWIATKPFVGTEP